MASFVVNSCIVFFSMLKLYLLPARGHHLPEHSRTKQAAGGGAPDELRPIGLLTVQLRGLRSRANSLPTPSASSTTPMHRLRSDEQLGSEKASHFPGWLKAIPHQDGLLWDSYIRHIYAWNRALASLLLCFEITWSSTDTKNHDVERCWVFWFVNIIVRSRYVIAQCKVYWSILHSWGELELCFRFGFFLGVDHIARSGSGQNSHDVVNIQHG